MTNHPFIIGFKLDRDKSWQFIRGREAWALSQLANAGERGVTPFSNPAPRLSAYIHALRKRGIVIETLHETLGGPFPGTHGRYVLLSLIEIKEQASA